MSSDAPRDANREPSLIGKSDADNSTVVIEADPATSRLKVNATVTGNPGASSTSAVTSVNDTASSTTLLTSNTNRLEAIFYNESSSVLYLKLGTTASATSYTVQLANGDYFSTSYKGQIDGIWSSDSTGAARITELT